MIAKILNKSLDELTDEEVLQYMNGEITLRNEIKKQLKKEKKHVKPTKRELDTAVTPHPDEKQRTLHKANEDLPIIWYPEKNSEVKGYSPEGEPIIEGFNYTKPTQEIPQRRIIVTPEQDDVLRWIEWCRLEKGKDAFVSIKGLYKLWKRDSLAQDAFGPGSYFTYNEFKTFIIPYFPIYQNRLAKHKAFVNRNQNRIRIKKNRAKLPNVKLGISITPNMRYSPQEIKDAYYLGISPEKAQKIKENAYRFSQIMIEKRKEMFRWTHRRRYEERMMSVLDFIKKNGWNS